MLQLKPGARYLAEYVSGLLRNKPRQGPLYTRDGDGNVIKRGSLTLKPGKFANDEVKAKLNNIERQKIISSFE